MRSSEFASEAWWRTRVLPGLTLAGILTGSMGQALPQEAAGGKPELKPTLERLGNFTYAGDPILLRVAVFNTGDQPYDNKDGLNLMGNLGIIDLDQGRNLKVREAADPDRRAEPAWILPGGFFGRILDLHEAVDGMDAPGHYTARLSLAGHEPQEVPLVVIPRFDPEASYRAVVETDYGKMSFDLHGKDAPKHVQNFYDLANQGYYDGTQFQAIVKGIEIYGGDRAGDGSSSPGYTLAPEISPTARHRRGTLSMLRMGPGDHGSVFVISLGETRERDGVFTIFGSLAAGEEVLAALEGLPTSGTREMPPYKPLKAVPIRSIRVEPATQETPSPSPATN